MERDVFRGLLIFAGVLLAVWAFFLILLPFIVPIAWALCLCATTAKPYRWMATKWRKPRLAAFIMVLLTAAVVLVPMVFIGALVIEQASELDFAPTLENLKAHMPRVVGWLEDTLLYFRIGSLDDFLSTIQKQAPELAGKLFSGGAMEGALNVIISPFIFLFGLVLTLITQYFVYRESPRLRRLVVDISPLDEEDTDRVLDTLRGTTAAGIIGGLLVALIQGALGGIMFAIAGIQSPAVWAIVMAAFSLLPFGGTALVWAPAGVYLLFTGSTFGGWFVLIFGTVIVGGADNFLRPWVLTKTGADDIHPMLLFFAILSGIGLFGVSGIVFGPLLLGLLTTMVQIYRAHWGPGAQWLEDEEGAASDAKA